MNPIRCMMSLMVGAIVALIAVVKLIVVLLAALAADLPWCRRAARLPEA